MSNDLARDQMKSNPDKNFYKNIHFRNSGQ